MTERENRTFWLLGAAAGTVWLTREISRQRNEVSLVGNVVLITGGSRGLGLCLAQELIQQGCKLALCARDENELYRAKEQLEAAGGEVFVSVCDITDKEQVAHTVRQTLAHYGQVDVLINNAGQIVTGPAQVWETEDYERQMEADFYGALYFVYELLPHFRTRRSGRIVNISSLGGRIAVPHLLPYSCAKFALTGFSEGLRAELKRDKITVTTIFPGTLRTGSHYQTQVRGHQEQEFANFSLSATLPLISTSAESAARQIILATKRGEAERVISVPAKLATLFHGIFPGVTSDLFGVFNEYVLPEPGGSSETQIGKEIARGTKSPLMSLVSKLGRRTAQRLNQFSTDEKN